MYTEEQSRAVERQARVDAEGKAHGAARAANDRVEALEEEVRLLLDYIGKIVHAADRLATADLRHEARILKLEGKRVPAKIQKAIDEAENA